ncbi:MAG: hypothetical protein KJ706_07475 [Candidatus Omnitrophica bacterium]|nr:hypothetical protein [Candidatus Omnitrophota bacterium]
MREIFSDKGYTQAEMDSGIELAWYIIGKVKEGKTFPRLEDIIESISNINILKILDSNL